LLDVTRAAIEGGTTAIQLRDKQASTRQLVEAGQLLRRLTNEYGVLLIVNDRIDVALAVDADGVHLGQDDDMPLCFARQLLGADRILGISAGNPLEATAALNADADYISVGPIYATSTKADAGPAIGTALLSELATRTETPLIGIGGITIHNAAPVIRAQAAGIAVVSAVVSAENISGAARELVEIIRQTQREHIKKEE
jgi:thiamine-phosphate diphosphorylase